MEELLERAKDYARIDGTADDPLLKSLILSAKEYMENAGVDEQDSELYKLGILMLVTHWWETREQVTGSMPQAITLGLQSIILQLKSWC